MLRECLCAISRPGDVRLCEPIPRASSVQGSHLNLLQTSAQRHRKYFLLNNKAVNSLKKSTSIGGTRVSLSVSVG